MTVIGYARASTTDQNLDVQENALRAAGCDLIRSEKRSGTTTAGREERRTVLDFLRAGDVLMVTRIDRLARSIGDPPHPVVRCAEQGFALKGLSGSRPRGKTGSIRVSNWLLRFLPRRRQAWKVAYAPKLSQ